MKSKGIGDVPARVADAGVGGGGEVPAGAPLWPPATAALWPPARAADVGAGGGGEVSKHAC